MSPTHLRIPLTPGAAPPQAAERRCASCHRLRPLVAATLMFIAAPVVAQPERSTLVPPRVELAEPARKAIEAPFLTDEERKELRVFHGAWEPGDLDTPARRATVALNAWAFDDESLADPTVPAEIRAEALALAGDVEGALRVLDGVRSLHADRIRAEALETIGSLEAADQAIEPAVALLLARELHDAAALNEGVRSLMVRSRLRGQPARDYQTMLDLLATARERYDRLHWPVLLTEARLLLDKDNMPEALAVLQQALQLNPRCAEAWYELGLTSVARFDFDGARAAAGALQALHPAHPLADLLLAESAMIQNDPDLALQLLDGVLARYPKQRAALALRCAAIALTYDEPALAEALRRHDELSPGSARAHYEVGRFLSFDRQYEAAAAALNEAIARQPKWPAPRIELGLLELQSGRDALALSALRDVRELDRYNKRVANSLFLLEELMSAYRQVETEHFIIRYSPTTEDRVFVDMMPETLERIHAAVAGRFGHEPDRKTIIEVLPNHKWFGVRIGGMPFIHTIAACTGPVIAMEVPREGPRQLHLGPFDWPRVLQHEYTHTITLSQTRNRIPHWLTEAAAVSMEFAPRRWETVQLLVNAWRTNELFDLDAINWAFVRPRKPTDRALAYAQGHWMVEFMNERFGEEALVRLLARYFDGEREQQAIPNALGLSREQFHADFLAWAGEQVKTWGFDPQPAFSTLLEAAGIDSAVRPGEPVTGVTDAMIEQWLAEHPDHPDVLRLAIERTLARMDEPDLMLIPLLEKYAAARPADPMPHRVMARIWQRSDTPHRAIPHLEQLDVREEYSNVYAVALAEMYRSRGDLDRAMEKITRAVNINPYHAPIRETAAAIALQKGDLSLARRHVMALTILEPGRPQHQRRLEAIEKRIADAGLGS